MARIRSGTTRRATMPVTGNKAIAPVGGVDPEPIVGPDESTLHPAGNESSGASLLAFDTTVGAARPVGTADVDEEAITGLAPGPDDHTFHVARTTDAATAGPQTIQH